MWFTLNKILPWHETCKLALAKAKLLHIKEGSSEVNALHLLKGIARCGDPKVVAVFNKLELDYNEEVSNACDIAEEQVEQFVSGTSSYTNEVKKILARGRRCAQKKKRKEISALDLLIGIVEESPRVVSVALNERSINWQKVSEMISEEAEQVMTPNGS